MVRDAALFLSFSPFLLLTLALCLPVCLSVSSCALVHASLVPALLFLLFRHLLLRHRSGRLQEIAMIEHVNVCFGLYERL